jgi:hypothetical protein
LFRFFFNYSAPSGSYPRIRSLSLHDALPGSVQAVR